MKIHIACACAVFAALSQFGQAATIETITPSSMFTARLIGGRNVIVGGIAEGVPYVGSSIDIKEGTSDRGILEYDIRNRSRAANVTLSVALANLDDPNFTPIYLYAFKANGVTNANDYYKTDKLITTFTDLGLADNSTPPYFLPFSFDVTDAYNQAITSGDDFIGFLFKNTVGGAQYARYWIITGPPGANVPALTVTVPELGTLSLALPAGAALLPFASRLRRPKECAEEITPDLLSQV